MAGGYGNPLAALAGGLMQGFAPVVVQRLNQRHAEEREQEALKLKTLEMLGNNVDLSDPGSLTAYTHMLDEYIGTMGGKGGKKGKAKQAGIFSNLSSSLVGGGGGDTEAGPGLPGGTAGEAPTPVGKMRVKDPTREGEQELKRRLPTMMMQEKLRAQDETRKAEDQRKAIELHAQKGKDALRIKYDLIAKNAEVKDVRAFQLKAQAATEARAAEIAASYGEPWGSLDDERKDFYRQMGGEELATKWRTNQVKADEQIKAIKANVIRIGASTRLIDQTLLDKQTKGVMNVAAAAKLKGAQSDLKGLHTALENEERQLNAFKADPTQTYNLEGIEAHIQELKQQIDAKEGEVRETVGQFNNPGAPVHRTPTAPVKHTPVARTSPDFSGQKYKASHIAADAKEAGMSPNEFRKYLAGKKITIDESQ